MQVDKTTLQDLSIIHADEEQSVFYHLNNTQTNGGREYLRYILSKPLDTLAAITDTQLLIKQLIAIEQEWPVTITNGTIMVCLLYTSPSPRDRTRSRMPSSA